MNKKPLALAVSLALAALATQPAQAITVNWIGTDGWWNNGTNWSNGLQPQNGNDVYIRSPGANSLTVNYENTLYPTAVLNSLYIQRLNGRGPVTFSQTKDSLSVLNEGIYYSTFNQSGGTHTVTNLSLSNNSAYNLNEAGILSSKSIVFIDSGSIFNQSGGTHTVNFLSVGGDDTGTYNLSGTGSLSAGYVSMGSGGAGGSVFNQSGGTHTVSQLDLSLGTYNLSGTGSLSSGTVYVGGSAFNQSGGTHAVNTLTLGGTYTLDGGTLLVGAFGTRIGTGVLNINGGTLSVGGGNGSIDVGSFVLGKASGSNINYTMSATGLYDGAHKVANGLTAGNLIVGDSGIGTFTQDGGTLNVGAIGGTGTLNINGGTLSVSGSIDVGTLVLGKALGSNVGYTLSTTGLYNGANKVANALSVRNLTMGDSGTSTFRMAGGSLFIVDTLTQNAASSLTGFGIVSANNISNAGTINAKSGNLALSGASFSNTGLIKNSVGSNLFIEAATVNHQGNIEVNSAGSVVFDAAITNAAGKNVTLLGGTLATPTLTNEAGGNVKGFGALSGNLTNAGSVEFYGPTNIVGDVLNQSGGTILVRNNQTLITGHTVNDGTIQTLQGTVIFEGGLTNNGAYLSDPSDNYFTDLTVGQTGYLVGEIGDNFLVSGNFVNNSLQNTLWNTSAASLTLTGLAPQNMYLAGDDLGALTSGYDSNYAWGEFSLVLGASVKLWDGNGDPGAALYVGLVELGGGLGQLSSIDSTYNIYYDASLAGNAYLGGQTYALNGGGSLMAVQAVPEAETYAMMLAGLGLVGFMARRRKQAAI